jgi:hypothetical protein
MIFSTSTKLSDYCNNEAVKKYLKANRMTILNKEQVEEYLQRAPLSISRKSRRISSVTNKLEAFITKQREIFGRNITERLCNVMDTNDNYYIQSQEDQENMDVLYLFHEKYNSIPPKIVSEDDYVKYKLQQVYGIIIVKKGECISNPILYTVVKCCCFIKDFVPILLGAFLFVIKTEPSIAFKRGIAYETNELSKYYSNFGFRQNSNLECINTLDLPLSIDLELIKPEEIIEKATGYENIPLQKTIIDANDLTKDSPAIVPKKSVKQLIAEYEKKIKSIKGGKRKTKKRKRRRQSRHS